MFVKDVMSQEVHTVSPDMTVKKAAEAMTSRKVGSLIVVTDTKLEGIITERDIMAKLVSVGKDASETKVRDVMTKKIVFIDPNSDIEEAAELMIQKKVKKLPVVSQNRLIGIITSTDIVTAEPKLMERLSSLVTFVKKKFVAG